MKKFLILACVASLALVTSCKKGNEPEPVDETPEVTVMFYGLGGNTLDYNMLRLNILPWMTSGSSDKVKFTIQFKASKAFQKDGAEVEGLSYLGTRRWVVPAEGEFEKSWDESQAPAVSTKEDRPAYVRYVLNALKPFATDSIGDGRYDMNKKESLTDFINWSVSKCPAKKYVLVMRDHGGGWDVYEDSFESEGKLKAQLYDDNFDSQTEKRAMAVSEMVKGIQQSKLGRVNTIILDECLMATFENLGEFAKIADYGFLSEEVTWTTQTTTDPSNFRDAAEGGFNYASVAKRQVDAYVAEKDKNHLFTSYGWYDFAKVSQLYAPVRDITSFLKDKYTNSVNWRSVMAKSFSQCIYASNVTNETTRARIINLKKQCEHFESLTDEQIAALEKEEYILNYMSSHGFCFYDIVNETIKQAKKDLEDGIIPEAEKTAFQSELSNLENMLKNYDAAIRNVAYINCTDQNGDVNMPYTMCSPSVFLNSFNENYFKPISRTCRYGYKYADRISRDEAIAVYNALEFDKNTHWSEFLKVICASGSMAYNPDRKYKLTGN